MRILFVAAILAVGGYFIYKSKPEPVAEQGQPAPAVATTCPEAPRVLKHQDNYMQKIVEPGSSINVVGNWYHCHNVDRNDLVLFKIGNDEPYVRVVRAIGGDKFKVIQNKKQKAWNLEVNGKLVMEGSQPYFFGGLDAEPSLKQAEISKGGVLAAGEVIVMALNSPGHADSGVYGIFSSNDLLGKITTSQGLSQVQEAVKTRVVAKTVKASNKRKPAASVKKKIKKKKARHK